MDTYPPLEWLVRRGASRVGQVFESAADMVPMGQAVKFRLIGAVKGGFKGVASVFPPTPTFEQLQGLPPNIGRAIDVLSADLNAGRVTAVPGDVERAVGQVIIYAGAPGQGGVMVAPSFFGRDP